MGGGRRWAAASGRPGCSPAAHTCCGGAAELRQAGHKLLASRCALVGRLQRSARLCAALDDVRGLEDQPPIKAWPEVEASHMQRTAAGRRGGRRHARACPVWPRMRLTYMCRRCPQLACATFAGPAAWRLLRAPGHSKTAESTYTCESAPLRVRDNKGTRFLAATAITNTRPAKRTSSHSCWNNVRCVIGPRLHVYP